jgi:hypothetical protein
VIICVAVDFVSRIMEIDTFDELAKRMKYNIPK